MSGSPFVVTLLRHGEIEGPAHALIGALDPPLTSHGRAQMHSIVATMATRFNAVASSPLRRCRAFAAEVAAAQGVALEIIPGLAEMRFGAWEGLTAQAAAARDPDRYAAFRADPTHAEPPGGEPYADFARRVGAAFAAWTHGGEGWALAVTHAGVMRALLAEWLGLSPTHLYRIALPPAATCRVSIAEGEPPCLLALNFGAVD